MTQEITYIVYLLIRISRGSRISQMRATPIYHLAKFFKNWVEMEKKKVFGAAFLRAPESATERTYILFVEIRTIQVELKI